MATELAFRRVEENIAAGQTRELGSFRVDGYRQIRVAADERQGSANDVDVRLTITEGDVLVAQLDVLKLTPGLEVTKVYDVPGTRLTVFAIAATGTEDSSSTVDVLIYGFASQREDADRYEPASRAGANRANRRPAARDEGVNGEDR